MKLRQMLFLMISVAGILGLSSCKKCCIEEECYPETIIVQERVSGPLSDTDVCWSKADFE